MLEEQLAIERVQRHGEKVVAQQVAKRRRLQEQRHEAKQKEEAAAAAAKVELKRKTEGDKEAAATSA